MKSQRLWTKHISGHTPAGIRSTLLKEFVHLPADTRGILSNCACLGEGVDVPVLDETFLVSRTASAPGLFTIGVRGLTPPGSPRLQLELDIIQAAGRVIRKAEGKLKGTIVIPVFIDETEDADHVLSQSTFEPVWQVHKTLRVHDAWKPLDGLCLGRRRMIQWKSNARIC